MLLAPVHPIDMMSQIKLEMTQFQTSCSKLQVYRDPAIQMPSPDDPQDEEPRPKRAQRTPSIRKPKLPKREEAAEQVLDLTCLKTLGEYNKQALSESSVCRTDLSLLSHVFKHSRRLVVITGAGISVSSGIPDFRSTTGLFTLLKNDLKLKASGKQMFDASVVYNDTTSTQNFHTTICDLHDLCSKSEPTPFHKCINEISKDKRLLRLYSQNIDCLDANMSYLSTRTPLEAPWPTTIQLHGSIQKMNCTKCNWMGDFDASVFNNCDVAPECPECKEIESVRSVAGKRPQGIGRLRPRVVLYNEFNPDADAIGQVSEADLTSRPDGLIVVGTTLKIPGVRRLVREMSQAVHAAKGATVWMNIDDPPQISKREFEGCFDLIVKGDCQIIPQLMADYEQEKLEIEQKKAEERRAKAEAKEAARLLRQKQALERAEKRAERDLLKAKRTKSEGSMESNSKKRKMADEKPILAKRIRSEIIGFSLVPELTSSGQSSSDYSLSESSDRDASPEPEVYVYQSVTSLLGARDARPEVLKQPGQQPGKRRLGGLKRKSVNTSLPGPTKEEPAAK